MHNILSITDRALAAYLTGQSLPAAVKVYPMKRSLGKELPCVIIHSNHAMPESGFDATYTVDVAVLVRTLFAVDVDDSDVDPIDRSDAIVAAVMAALHRFGDGAQSGQQLSEAITEAGRGAGLSDFTCQDASVESIDSLVDYKQESDAWTDAINMKLTCCPAAVG